jgi:PHD/YefM family antitoxin component YafN of YafNO toxin-antitoxin module
MLMFETRGSAAFAALGDLRTRAKQTIEMAQEKPVYLLRDGEPVAGIVSIEMLELLQDVLEDRYVSDVAQQRLQALRDGTDELLDEDDFCARADAIMATRK